jgi:hypothetical protein
MRQKCSTCRNCMEIRGFGSNHIAYLCNFSDLTLIEIQEKKLNQFNNCKRYKEVDKK